MKTVLIATPVCVSNRMGVYSDKVGHSHFLKAIYALYILAETYSSTPFIAYKDFPNFPNHTIAWLRYILDRNLQFKWRNIFLEILTLKKDIPLDRLTINAVKNHLSKKKADSISEESLGQLILDAKEINNSIIPDIIGDDKPLDRNCRITTNDFLNIDSSDRLYWWGEINDVKLSSEKMA